MGFTNQDLRKAGLKVTLPRVKILELLQSAEQHHLSAEDIYKKLIEQGEDIGLATVYRVLTQFEQANIVDRHNFDNNLSVFEIAQEEHHDHMICNACGKIMEFHSDVIIEAQEAIAKELGFQVSGHSLVIYGLCSDEKCR